MKTKKTYAVFGLGRYGMAVARELVDNGMEVIAVDGDQRNRFQAEGRGDRLNKSKGIGDLSR